MTSEPLLDLQARLDAYEAMLPVQAGAFVNACVTAWLVESLIPQAVLLNLLNLLPANCNHHQHKRRQYVARTHQGIQQTTNGTFKRIVMQM